MLVTITNFFPDTIATTITSTSTGVIIGGSLSGVITLIVIIIGTIICVAAIHSKKSLGGLMWCHHQYRWLWQQCEEV